MGEKITEQSVKILKDRLIKAQNEKIKFLERFLKKSGKIRTIEDDGDYIAIDNEIEKLNRKIKDYEAILVTREQYRENGTPYSYVIQDGHFLVQPINRAKEEKKESPE